MLIDQISVFLSNQPGRLTDITGILSRANIDIRALSLADTNRFRHSPLNRRQSVQSRGGVGKSGLTVRKTKVIAAKLEDRPGPSTPY